MEEQLVTLCLQTLVAVLDVRLPGTDVSSNNASQDPSRRSSVEEGRRLSVAGSSESGSFSAGATQEASGKQNDFRFYVRKLHRPQDFLLLMDGFARLLKNPLDSANTYLPGSTKRVNIHTEVLMVFWKLLENNEKFAHQAMEADKILVIFASVLYFALQARNDPSQFGLLRTCSFLLHIMSQDRNFCVQLNNPFDHAVAGAAAKAVPSFTNGTWGDFLFLAIHTLCTASTRLPTPSLHETFLTILANVSPFAKTLTVTTAAKLLSLFSAYSNPAYMLANEHNHKNVFYLIEVFNNVLQYQVTGNTHLVYSILRHKQKFYDLHNLTYEHAVSELQRVRALRAQIRQGGTQPQKGAEPPKAELENKDSSGSLDREASQGSLDDGKPDDDTELSEKAKGKLPAGRLSVSSANGKESHAPPVDEKGKFQPNQEWFHYWHAHLPLSIILTLLDTLGPTVENLCVEKDINDDRTVLEYLQSGTLVGLLPVPHPIYTRRFWMSPPLRVWFLSWFWGCVYTKSNGMGAGEAAKMCPPIWIGTDIKLFHIKVST